MSISQPSKEIYVVDVPEVKELTATYYYNFFVPDESVNATGGVPSNILSRPGAEVDSSFVQFSITRAPRFVRFNWTLPKLADVGNLLSEQAQRNNAFRTTGEQDGSLILNNIDKVVNEDDFASNNYVSIHFHDGKIDEKIHQLVSGTIVQQSLQEETDTNVSPYKAAQRLIPQLPNSISPHLIYQSMIQPDMYGATFYSDAGMRGGMSNRLISTRYLSNYFNRLKSVGVNTQINSKLIHDMVNRTIADPGASQGPDMVNMHTYTKQVQHAVNQRFSPAVSDQDFKTFVPFIKAKKHSTAAHIEKYGSEIVGYIIDKFEIMVDGSTKSHPPIVVDSPHAGVTADFQVKFNAQYCYTIRTIALLTMPAIDDDSGDVATIKVLVSSKPSNKIYVSTLKLDSPPPPADINFVWNFETAKLMVTWAFPVTSERDIKQFQVFRRSDINHCFELQKAYNFDDSIVPFPSPETPDNSLVERLTSPATFWIDDEFSKDNNFSPEKSYIYTVAAIDAHGLTSNYGAQYRVWFDRFKNRLQKELVSHTGAPKPYPNLYLEGELFRNTINVAGPHSKRMKVYFNPEYYYIYDDDNRQRKVIMTKQSGGSYKLQFINVDNLKSQEVNITIDDRLTASQRTISYPNVQFGPKRKLQRSHS